MADKAHNAADVRLEKMEKRLAGIYHRAQRGIEEKASAYFKQFERLDAEKRKLVEAEKMTEAEYKQWRQNKMLYGKRYTDLKKQIAAEIANVNETAYAYINEQLPELYALGYDAFSDVADGIPGYSFTLVDADTVRHLATTDKSILPYKKLDRAKDIPWNMKRVNAEVLQGILQGESIPKIAARMQKVTGSNAKAAVRTARTAVTEAENRGRQDSYERAKKDGVMLKRKWIATYDMRTRHAHALLDGQLAEVDEPFESELGPIMFPGDHTAHPSNVYNCRCTLGVKYLGFDGKKTKIKSEDDRDTVTDWLKKEREKDPKGFDIKQKMVYNESADRKQYQEYRSRLGRDMPNGGFSTFQKLKYTDADAYEDLKAYFRYKGISPQSDRRFFEANKKFIQLKQEGKVRAKGTIISPPRDKKIIESNDHSILSFAERNMTQKDAQNIVDSALFALEQRKGQQHSFYSEKGYAVVNTEGLLTSVGWLDDGGKLLYKEVSKYVKV